MAKHKLPAAVLKKAQPKKPNPFELKKSRTKFEAVGRRIKGAVKNVVQARQDAHNKRKATLLVEYKQLRKANTFQDKRLGESGSSNLTEDERALAKLQALRTQQARQKRKGASKFVLSEADERGPEEGLTHMGKSLADIQDLNEAPPSLDELDDDMVADLVATYNFGGGEEEAAGAAGEGRKTRKQVMEEIIAKSKMYKALKAKQKEEDEKELDQLNEEFRELIAQHSLKKLIKPPGYFKGVKIPAESENDAAYDVAARALAEEARAAAGERTLTREELEIKEKERLEALEKDRLRRMRGEESVEAMEVGPAGGYAARRKRLREQQEAEEDSDDEGESEDEDEGSEGDDDDELQQLAGPLVDDAELEPDVELSGDEDGDEEEEEEEGEDDEDEEGEGQEGDSEDQSVEANSDEDVSGSEDDNEDEGEEEDGGEDSADEEHQAKTKAQPKDVQTKQIKNIVLLPPAETAPVQPSQPASSQQQQQGDNVQGSMQVDEPLDLPYTIPLPASYEAFARLVAGRPAHHMLLAIQRIHAFNAQQLAAESKKQLQVFYGMLVQHYVMLSGQTPLSLPHLDTLFNVLLHMTAEVPFYAATVARARLQRLHERLNAALKAANVASDTKEQTGASQCWPNSRALMQIRLFMLLFPTSDRRHPVVTPLSLLVNKYLSQCTAQTLQEVSTGLLLCNMSISMAKSGNRFAPEPLNFLTDALLAALPAGLAESASRAGHSKSQKNNKASEKQQNGTANGQQQSGKTIQSHSKEGGGTGGGPPKVVPQLLHVNLSKQQATELNPQPVSLLEALQSSNSSDGAGGDGQSQTGPGATAGLLAVVLTSAKQASQAVMSSAGPAGPQAVAPLLSALRLLGKASHLPPALEKQRRELLQELTASCKEVETSRTPLVQAARIRAPVVKEYNPRFEEEGFALGRDYDPDRIRAEQRKLKRQVQKEKRGAMRELRRDAVFLAAERDHEKAAVDAERMESQRRFYSELEAFESDMKSGGQKGMNPHLKNKKARK